MSPTRVLARRSRLTTVVLILVSLFLIGTVIVLSTAKAYFSIDKSAYILSEELGTWQQIKWGGANGDSLPAGWATRYPWLYQMLRSKGQQGSNSGVVEENQDIAGGLSSASSSSSTQQLADASLSPPEKVPRIIHQTWKSEQLPPKWQAIREECMAMHPDYDFKLWTDTGSRDFIAEHYPWFLPVFDAYPYGIQRADAIRYFVLHYYGGVYMDLDIGCNRRLDPLLRFEVILPVTRPVGISNDLIFSAKGHPFMDQVIHNLVTFNHRYLTHYPTVMFSTGPMFVSASYGLYVDSHGAATPSTPSNPAAGFSGVRVLPKPLYGKNAKPSEVPESFFKHFYGSSWHANDADFLIFLRDHGRFLMFVVACVVAYGFYRTVAPRVSFHVRKQRTRERERRPSRRAGHWVGLPIQASATRHSSQADRAARRATQISRMHAQTPDTHADMSPSNDATPIGETPPSLSGASEKPFGGSADRGGSRPVTVAAPRPQRFSVPLFELQEEDRDAASDSSGPSRASMDDGPQGFLEWAGLSHSGSSSSSTSSLDAALPSGWPRASDVMLLPAYVLNRIGSPLGAREDLSGRLPQHVSPACSRSSSASTSFEGGGGDSHPSSSSLFGKAAQLLPNGWRSPVDRSRGDGDSSKGDMEMKSTYQYKNDSRSSRGGRRQNTFSGLEEGERTPMADQERAHVFSGVDHLDVDHRSSALGQRRLSDASSASSSAWLDARAPTPTAAESAGGFLTPGSASTSRSNLQSPTGPSYRTPPPPYDGSGSG